MTSLKKIKELPLTLWLQGDPTPLFIQKTIRSIPGKRWVISALWGDRQVVAKVFSKLHHAQRELKGSQALQKSGIRTPELLFHGWCARIPCYVLIFEKIDPAQDLDSAWWLGNPQQRVELLEQAVTVVAKLHQVALKQNDLHLQNFLVDDQSRLHVIDGSSISQTTNGHAVNESEGLKNLALLYAQIAPGYDQTCERGYRIYAKERGLVFTRTRYNEFKNWIRSWRQQHFRTYGKKVFRNTNNLICHQTWNQYSICNRDYYSDAVQKLLVDPEFFLQNSPHTKLKTGNTCTVFQFELENRTFVVKRYNIKNFWHGLNRAFRRSRAAYYWRNAMCLASWRLGVAKPIALVEKRIGPLRKQAYYMMEYVQGTSLQNLANNSSKENVVKDPKIQHLFFDLEAIGLSHGDLKADNIIFADGEPVLLDLDAMKLHRFRWAWQRANRRDLERFMKNWS